MIIKMENCEYILCSAIWYKDLSLKQQLPNMNPINIDKGIVLCGFRHLQCVRQLNNLTGLRSVRSEVGEYIQGFLTSENLFVNRAKGLQIAIASKQVEEYKTIHNNHLFSEDLW